MDTINSSVPLDDITRWAPEGSCHSLQMLRLDAIHPVVSGNKWFKLRYNIAAASTAQKSALLTFGGGYSNHLLATAFAAREAGLSSIGIVRGHYTDDRMTATLRACVGYGMSLIPCDKDAYAAMAYNPLNLTLAHRFPDALIIPEGGANEAGIRGASDIAELIPGYATDVCVAVGSGTTVAGLHTALSDSVRLHGFCSARGCAGAKLLVAQSDSGVPLTMRSVTDPRFGRWTSSQLEFMRDFYDHTGIRLDVVYTGKMMMDVYGLLRDGSFGTAGRIICIHTGGLQGNPPGLFA